MKNEHRLWSCLCPSLVTEQERSHSDEEEEEEEECKCQDVMICSEDSNPQLLRPHQSRIKGISQMFDSLPNN